MDAMVTARVPVEIKKRGDSKLKEIGSSATELVNSAYEYVLQTGKLPRAKATDEVPGSQVKTLSGEAVEEFRRQWAARSAFEPSSYDGANFKELLDQARGDRHARLA